MIGIEESLKANGKNTYNMFWGADQIYTKSRMINFQCHMIMFIRNKGVRRREWIIILTKNRMILRFRRSWNRVGSQLKCNLLIQTYKERDPLLRNKGQIKIDVNGRSIKVNNIVMKRELGRGMFWCRLIHCTRKITFFSFFGRWYVCFDRKRTVINLDFDQTGKKSEKMNEKHMLV